MEFSLNNCKGLMELSETILVKLMTTEQNKEGWRNL